MLDSNETKSTDGYVFTSCNLEISQKYCGRNDNPTKSKVDLVETNDYDGLIVAIISQANIMVNVKEWMVAFIYKQNILSSHTPIEEWEEII